MYLAAKNIYQACKLNESLHSIQTLCASNTCMQKAAVVKSGRGPQNISADFPSVDFLRS